MALGLRFSKCSTCGSYGHRAGRHCPVNELNREMEKRNADVVTAEMLFPNQPELVQLLKDVQRNWLTERRLAMS